MDVVFDGDADDAVARARAEHARVRARQTMRSTASNAAGASASGGAAAAADDDDDDDVAGYEHPTNSDSDDGEAPAPAEAGLSVADEADDEDTRLRAEIGLVPEEHAVLSDARAAHALPPVPPVTLSWADVSVSVRVGFRKTKTVLHGVSGCARPGQVVAVMGSSGAGKSTLLQALAQRSEGVVRGRVLVNGVPIGERGGEIRGAGYVGQDDVLLPRLTVRESLRTTAGLMLPNAAEREARVQAVIEQLGLQRCADTRVGNVEERGVSGGERRRVMIAEVLVSNPSLIFLDEPTTGLDSTTALGVVQVLKQLADAGRTIVCTIHQPRSLVFNAFDQLVLMAEGRVVYAGAAADAVAYFAALGMPLPLFTNPADHLLDLTTVTGREDRDEAERRVRFLQAAHRRHVRNAAAAAAAAAGSGPGAALLPSGAPLAIEAPPASPTDAGAAPSPSPPLSPASPVSAIGADAPLNAHAHARASSSPAAAQRRCCCRTCCGVGTFRTSWCSQCRALLPRACINHWRNPLFTVVSTAQNIVMAVLIGLVFLQLSDNQTSPQNRAGALYLSMIFLLFSTTTRVANTIGTELLVVSKERAAHSYHASAYFVAKTVSEILLEVANPIVFVLVMYWIVGLNDSAPVNVIIPIAMYVIATLGIAGMITALASGMRSTALTLIVAPVAVLLGDMLTGFFVAIPSIPEGLRWMRFFSMQRYAFQAMFANELRGVTLTCDNGAVCGPSSLAPGLNSCSGAATFTPCLATGEEVLRVFGMDDVVIWECFVAIGTICVIYRLLAYLMVRLRVRPVGLNSGVHKPLVEASGGERDAADDELVWRPKAGVDADADIDASALDASPPPPAVPAPVLLPRVDDPAPAALPRVDSGEMEPDLPPPPPLAPSNLRAHERAGALSNPMSSASSSDLLPVSSSSSRMVALGRIFPVTFEWRSVTLDITTSRACCGRPAVVKKVLRSCSGVVRPGQMLAVMGASGSGKTSMLNVLAQRAYGSITGRFTVNGEPLGEHIHRLGYVTQDDTLLPTMTVRETLEFTARLRLPPSMSHAEKMRRVEDVIDELGLRKVADTRVGSPEKRGLSGGERRRLSIAEVLITNPSLVFLDEPTSGLDAATSLSLIRTLRELAQMGRSIVFTIHQPRSDIYAEFDKIMLLARGQPIFYGRADRAAEYFASLTPVAFPCPANTTPSDFFLDLTTARTPDDEARIVKRIEYLAAMYRLPILARFGSTGVAPVQDNEPISRKVYSAGFCLQFFLLLQRSWRARLRDPSLVLLQVGQAALASLFVGFLYFQLANGQTNIRDRQGLMYFLVIYYAGGNLGFVMQGLQMDKKLLIRERMNNMYSVLPWYLAKNVAELLFETLSPIIFTAIVYYIANLNPAAERFFACMGISILFTVMATSITYAVGAIAPNEVVANMVAALPATLFALFGGFLSNSRTIPDGLIWLERISYMKYGYAALVVNEFTGVTYNCSAGAPCAFLTGEAVLDNIGFGPASNFSIWLALVVLAGMLVFWRLVTFVVLWLNGRNSFDKPHVVASVARARARVVERRTRPAARIRRRERHARVRSIAR